MTILRGTDPNGERFGVHLRSWGMARMAFALHPTTREPIIHWYADAWYYHPNDELLEKWEVQRTLDEDGVVELRAADEASPLDLVRQDAGRYKVGDTTTRWPTKEAAAEAGIALLRERFGEGVLVVEGQVYDVEPPILGRT